VIGGLGVRFVGRQPDFHAKNAPKCRRRLMAVRRGKCGIHVPYLIRYEAINAYILGGGHRWTVETEGSAGPNADCRQAVENLRRSL
jgi:hypothetical protein